MEAHFGANGTRVGNETVNLDHVLDPMFHNNIDDWDSHYGHLRENKDTSILLVLMLIPYGIQVGGW